MGDVNHLSNTLNMNKIFAALIASLFAAGSFAADAPKPAAAASAASAPAAKAEAKPGATAAAPASAAAKK